MNEIRQRTQGRAGSTSFEEALYQLVREMGYTWDDVMQEKLPRTLYSLEKLGEEAEERRKQQKKMKRKTPKP